jgi:hypothetical protein
MKDPQIENKNPRADKPSSLDATSAAPQALESQKPSGAKGSPDTAKSSSLVTAEGTPPAKKTPSLATADATLNSDPAELSKEKTTPPSPQSHGLGATGGVPTGGDSARP